MRRWTFLTLALFLLTIAHPYIYPLFSTGLLIYLSVNETLRAVVIKSVTIPKRRTIGKLRKKFFIWPYTRCPKHSVVTLLSSQPSQRVQ